MEKPYTNILVPEKGKPGLYLVLDENHYEWYDGDPLLDPNARRINLEDFILHEIGVDAPDRANPVKVKMRVVAVDRSIPFDVSLPNKIRMKQMNRHFVDYEGNVVDILDARNPLSGYPFNGVVLNRKGEMIGTRHYSPSGLCDDAMDEHAIFAIDGQPEFISVEDSVDGFEDGAEHDGGEAEE